MKDRQLFLEVYTEFDKWLSSMKLVNKRTNSYSDYLYTAYDAYVKHMYAVEHYTNESIGIDIRFLRDNDEHKFYILHGVNHLDHKTYSIDEFKSMILEKHKEVRDEIIESIQHLMCL